MSRTRHDVRSAVPLLLELVIGMCIVPASVGQATVSTRVQLSTRRWVSYWTHPMALNRRSRVKTRWRLPGVKKAQPEIRRA